MHYGFMEMARRNKRPGRGWKSSGSGKGGICLYRNSNATEAQRAQSIARKLCALCAFVAFIIATPYWITNVMSNVRLGLSGGVVGATVT
jgi:hypothetical protein